MAEFPIVHFGLAGLGNVGAGVIKNLQKNGALLASRAGVRLVAKRISVRDIQKYTALGFDAELLTTDWRELVDDPEIKVIVELMGGVNEAYDLVKTALLAKKAVVTGNKALLAKHGHELVALAGQNDVPLYFEAAVAGGIPIIKAVREALIGNNIQAIYGIINGTTNYILTRMADADLTYEDALAEAQAKGYAEADPTLDVTGWDAGHKAIILAWLSYGSWVKPEQVHVEGIAHITRVDLTFARNSGYAIKLLGVVRLDASNNIEVRVQPCLIHRDEILAHIDGVMNAVAVYGDIVGETLFYGSGAGQDATSSSVISDLADAAENLINEAGVNHGFVPHGHYGTCLPVEESISSYYLRLRVDDRPGVVASVATILAAHGIGISSMSQPEVTGNEADVMLMLHKAPFGKMKAASSEIGALDCMCADPVLLRVETLPGKKG